MFQDRGRPAAIYRHNRCSDRHRLADYAPEGLVFRRMHQQVEGAKAEVKVTH